MNFEKLSQCKTLEDCVKEILVQNYSVYKIGKKQNDAVKDIEGFYIRANNDIENTALDILFITTERMFLNVMEEKDNEDMKRDSMILTYEVLINYVEGKYTNFHYQVKTVEDFVALAKDRNKSEELGKYISGCVQRLAKNMLYQRKDKNAYSQKKWYCHATGTKKTKNIYFYNEYFYLDRKYTLDENISSGYDLLDAEYCKNGKYDVLEDEVFSLERDTMMGKIFEDILTDSERNRINERIATQNKQSVSRGMLMKRIENSNDNTLAVKDAILCYGGDFLSFGDKLFNENNLIRKFFLIKKAINSDKIGEILLELITDLDYSIYKQLFEHLKNSSFVRYYVVTDNFRIILDTIMNEYISQQNRLKEIYLYNESERREKVKKIRDLMLKEELFSLREVTQEFFDTFKLKLYYTQSELSKLEVRLNLIKDFLGLELERKGKKYRVKADDEIFMQIIA
ncbi:MAG: hypothetical protein J6J36_00405 [Clostridia bacterium]|nr:hypothetical protein [Clostridia bacterium]